MLERIGADDERRVGVAAVEHRRRAQLARARPRVPAGEAHGRRVARLPREHVLGAGGVGLVAQRDGDDVRDAAQVADERVQPERLDVPAHVVQDRARSRQPRSRAARSSSARLGARRATRRLADERAQRPQRLDVAVGRELDERVRLLRGRRPPLVDDDERRGRRRAAAGARAAADASRPDRRARPRRPRRGRGRRRAWPCSRRAPGRRARTRRRAAGPRDRSSRRSPRPAPPRRAAPRTSSAPARRRAAHARRPRIAAAASSAASRPTSRPSTRASGGAGASALGEPRVAERAGAVRRSSPPLVRRPRDVVAHQAAAAAGRGARAHAAASARIEQPVVELARSAGARLELGEHGLRGAVPSRPACRSDGRPRSARRDAARRGCRAPPSRACPGSRTSLGRVARSPCRPRATVRGAARPPGRRPAHASRCAANERTPYAARSSRATRSAAG